jgi:hypothetical protein
MKTAVTLLIAPAPAWARTALTVVRETITKL